MAPANTFLTDAAFEPHIAFWTTALGRISDDFHFRQPWLSMAPDAEPFVSVECPITPETASLIGELGRSQDPGVFVVVAGAVSLLLQTYTRADSIAIDTPPVAGDDRNERELVPIVTAIDRSASVRDYLAGIAETASSSYSFQQLPIARFAEVLLKRPRPKTNVFVSLNGWHDASIGADAHDLRIAITRQPALSIQLTGRVPAFSRAFLQGFARHLAATLEGFRDRAIAVGKIDVMGDAERQRLLVDRNTASKRDAVDGTIQEHFEQQASQRGTGIAIQLHDASVSYELLNRQANRLAQFLQSEYGVQKGDVVGVLTERSPLSIAALLAVLKAGAVYLPIDPDYPEDRLQFMVQDAAVKVLLVHSSHFDRVASLYETPMFALDIQLDTLDTSDANVAPACSPDDVAYIIYTSGSTGQPKAVLLEHRGFMTMVRHHIETFGVQPAERLLQFYGQSFDSSLFEIFVALLSGATLVLVDRDTINDPEQMAAYIEAQQITMLTLPPVYASSLNPTRLSSVRRYVSAGDHCRVEDALRLAGGADYYNSYGPTETSVCVTHFKVDPKGRYGSRIPIGEPISATAIYLLDDQLQLVPDGVVGEICVGGASVARGYLNRDELTNEKFVANPFAAGRLYRTGDLGVWLPDGNLELIGRKDNQVKIRGYRVELGEIQAVLDQHPLVRESAVIAREDDLGNKRLAAFVTGSGPIDVADLKSLVRARLPEFMMPSIVTVLDAMPLTANGKIDLKALAAMPDASAPAKGRALPETPVQRTLATVWQDILGVPEVGINDNLFDLGGDSILIIQIVARARECGLKLSPNQLFDRQTIAELAEVAVEVTASAPPVAEQEPIVGAAPLAPMQAWFFEQAFADAHHFNQSVTLEVPGGTIDVAAAAGAAIAVVTHHDALRLTFTNSNGRWNAAYAPVPDAAPFAVVDLTAVDSDKQDAAIADAVRECQSSFDLSKGPLFAVRLLQLSSGRPSRLLFAAHHLVVDGVSWRILLGDFSTAYTQLSRGDVVELPPKTTSFRTWTTALADAAKTLDSRYWLEAENPSARIRRDRPEVAGANTVGSAHAVTRTLAVETTAALLQDVPRAYTTDINDVLLAALALTFQQWSGEDTTLIDLEAHGREELVADADTSRTVGWFTAQFPIALRIATSASIDDAIKSIKEQLRAVPQRGASYGVLRYCSTDGAVVAALQARRAPEVLFNYFGQAGRVLAPELQWTLLPASATGDVSARAQRPHLLEINGMVADGRLTITWTFSDKVHALSTIEDLAARYEATLGRIVEHCRTVTTRRYTPSDFPASGLDQQSLDSLIAKINR